MKMFGAISSALTWYLVSVVVVSNQSCATSRILMHVDLKGGDREPGNTNIRLYSDGKIEILDFGRGYYGSGYVPRETVDKIVAKISELPWLEINDLRWTDDSVILVSWGDYESQMRVVPKDADSRVLNTLCSAYYLARVVFPSFEGNIACCGNAGLVELSCTP